MLDLTYVNMLSDESTRSNRPLYDTCLDTSDMNE
jgi:hypothetical protein